MLWKLAINSVLTCFIYIDNADFFLSQGSRGSWEARRNEHKIIVCDAACCFWLWDVKKYGEKYIQLTLEVGMNEREAKEAKRRKLEDVSEKNHYLSVRPIEREDVNTSWLKGTSLPLVFGFVSYLLIKSYGGHLFTCRITRERSNCMNEEVVLTCTSNSGMKLQQTRSAGRGALWQDGDTQQVYLTVPRSPGLLLSSTIDLRSNGWTSCYQFIDNCWNVWIPQPLADCHLDLSHYHWDKGHNGLIRASFPFYRSWSKASLRFAEQTMYECLMHPFYHSART